MAKPGLILWLKIYQLNFIRDHSSHLCLGEFDKYAWISEIQDNVAMTMTEEVEKYTVRLKQFKMSVR